MEEIDALEIIRALAEGVNPQTGEIFPADSPYQNADVVRALYKAIEAIRKSVKNVERKKTLPPRAGKPWDKTESDLLAKKFDEGIDIVQLAKEHGRTRWAITSKLVKLGKIEPSESSI